MTSILTVPLFCLAAKVVRLAVLVACLADWLARVTDFISIQAASTVVPTVKMRRITVKVVS